MSGRQWKPSVTSNLAWVQNKDACDQSTAPRAGFVRTGSFGEKCFSKEWGKQILTAVTEK